MIESAQAMTREIAAILRGQAPAIYLYGSVALNDFQLGWSDIDILVLTRREITRPQAEALLHLRQAMLERNPGNPYFGLFEGGMLSLDALLYRKTERTVYWGSSGQRIDEGYDLDSFGLATLLDCGIPLHGEDLRARLNAPAYEQLRGDCARHLRAVRVYGDSVGWLLDIARGIYTLRTGKVIAKTAAGEWALTENLCPDPEAMRTALRIRKEPLRYSKDERKLDSGIIQRFADLLDDELQKENRKL
ncbi:MAG: DUF4111 domain-containing protein [Oscillospiraceae bacterium]|nr:DUF4111 domain-containing protein [Oscillospiraceae bacterium]